MDNNRFVRHGEEYDSTWDDEEDDPDYEESNESPVPFSAYRSAARDMQAFRHKSTEAFRKLKDLTDDDMENEEVLPNLQFYQNKREFTPHGLFIEDVHSRWFGDYHTLECVHTYIQWLFPILEKGMNFESHELSLKEIKHFHQDEEIRKRLLTSYELMLDFYGLKLVDEETGEVALASNWKERFENLNRNSHNNLRITRILKCLGLLGLGHYQAPLVHFFLNEALVRRTLPRVKQSALDYFLFAVLDKAKRKELIRFAFDNYQPQELFVWCPRRICDKFQKENKMSNYKENDPNKGLSSELTSQSDNEEMLNSTVQNKDENQPGVHEESDTHALPILTEVNPNTADTDFQLRHRVASECQATVQEQSSLEEARYSVISNTATDMNRNDHADSAEPSSVQRDTNFDNSTASAGTTDNKYTGENAATETPPSRNLGSKQQDQEQRAEPELFDPKKSTEEIQKCGSESWGSGVVHGRDMIHEADSTQYNAEQSADIKCHRYTESEENSSRNLRGGNELRNLGDGLDTSTEQITEINEDLVNHSMEEKLKDRLTAVCVSNDAPSNRNSADVKGEENTEYEQETVHRSDENSSQVTLCNDTKTIKGEQTESEKEN